MDYLSASEKKFLIVVFSVIFIGTVWKFVSTKNSSAITKFRIEPLAANLQQANIARININTASFEELCSLPFIGETTAERILDYRKTNSRFNTKEDLLKIKGIGRKKLNKIENFITINGD